MFCGQYFDPRILYFVGRRLLVTRGISPEKTNQSKMLNQNEKICRFSKTLIAAKT